MKSPFVARAFPWRKLAERMFPLVAAAVVAGCASTPQARRRVEAELAGRGARPEISLASRPDSPETRAALARLLREPLTADRAARIVLVNNRRLRASLAAASFAEADLWRAARLPNPEVTGSMRFPSGGGAAASMIAVGFNALDGFLVPLRKNSRRRRWAWRSDGRRTTRLSSWLKRTRPGIRPDAEAGAADFRSRAGGTAPAADGERSVGGSSGGPADRDRRGRARGVGRGGGDAPGGEARARRRADAGAADLGGAACGGRGRAERGRRS